MMSNKEPDWNKIKELKDKYGVSCVDIVKELQGRPHEPQIYDSDILWCMTELANRLEAKYNRQYMDERNFIADALDDH